MKPIVAIVGRPNVGKSTLFNRIVGGHRAITLDTPGVTRDRRYEQATWDGRDFRVVDTGGLFLGEAGSIEKKIREQVDFAIEEAAVILFLMDGRAGLLPDEAEIAQYLRRSGRKVFLVVNKIDSPDQQDRLNDFYSLGEEVQPVSAEHGYWVNDLLDQVVQALPPDSDGAAEPNGIKIAIIGRPNVGKSSLLNRILGEERVVVHDVAGTTRDAIDTPVRIGTKEYLLIDTAGIRRKGKWSSKIERYSVLNSLKAIERADHCLMILDAVEGIHKQDAHVAGYISEAKKGLIILWNKWDVIGAQKGVNLKEERKKFIRTADDELKFLSHASILFISAKTGEGCDQIWPTIEKLHRDSGRRHSTSDVNRVFEGLINSHNPPVYRGKPVKFLYATQVSTFPTTFIAFVSDPRGVHFSFKRYLVNGFRKAFNLGGAPIEIIFRRKK